LIESNLIHGPGEDGYAPPTLWVVRVDASGVGEERYVGEVSFPRGYALAAHDDEIALAVTSGSDVGLIRLKGPAKPDEGPGPLQTVGEGRGGSVAIAYERDRLHVVWTRRKDGVLTIEHAVDGTKERDTIKSVGPDEVRETVLLGIENDCFAVGWLEPQGVAMLGIARGNLQNAVRAALPVSLTGVDGANLAMWKDEVLVVLSKADKLHAMREKCP
jgi:hypothetical protein